MPLYFVEHGLISRSSVRDRGLAAARLVSGPYSASSRTKPLASRSWSSAGNRRRVGRRDGDLDRAGSIRRAPGDVRPRDDSVRPGSRLPHGCRPVRPARGGLRPVQRGADGRDPGRAGDRGTGDRARRRVRLRPRARGRSPRSRRPSPSPSGSRSYAARTRRRSLPPPTRSSLATGSGAGRDLRRSPRRRCLGRRTPGIPPQPVHRGGNHRQRRRLLRRRGYETIWPLFVTDRGGGRGSSSALTFATFGLTTILVSPIGGRIVDRRGPFPFIVLGLIVMAGYDGPLPVGASTGSSTCQW